MGYLWNRVNHIAIIVRFGLKSAIINMNHFVKRTLKSGSTITSNTSKQSVWIRHQFTLYKDPDPALQLTRAGPRFFWYRKYRGRGGWIFRVKGKKPNRGGGLFAHKNLGVRHKHMFRDPLQKAMVKGTPLNLNGPKIFPLEI